MKSEAFHTVEIQAVPDLQIPNLKIVLMCEGNLVINLWIDFKLSLHSNIIYTKLLIQRFIYLLRNIFNFLIAANKYKQLNNT